VIVGAPIAAGGGTHRGASYVVFGKAGGFGASLDLSALDGSNGFALNGAANSDYSGYSVSAAGDVNGDGFADLIIGAPLAAGSGTNAGASYVVLGKAGGFAPTMALSALDGANGFALNGVANGDKSGFSVSAAGDVNGDGFADVIIGSKYAAESGTNVARATWSSARPAASRRPWLSPRSTVPMASSSAALRMATFPAFP